MKLRLLTLTACAALSGPTLAQTTVTLYGIVGLEVGRNIGSDDTVVQNGANSRVGIRAIEDLGGGNQAFATLEHRVDPESGTQSDAARFWNGAAYVGLQGHYGRIWLGRDYTPLFLDIALKGDPWSYTGIGALDSGLGGIGAYTRYDNTINYQIKGGGFSLWLQAAERDRNGTAAGTEAAIDRPMGVALSYASGPLYLGVGYDSRINDVDDLWAAVATYDFGAVKLYATYAAGTNVSDVKFREMVFAATAPLGSGQLRAGLDQIKRRGDAAVTVKQQVTVGYHYPLSRRTTVFVDVTNNSKVADNKTGFGIGLKHAF